MADVGRDLHGAVERVHGRYGDAFTFGFGPIRYAWFVGPEAARTIFDTDRDAFSQRGAYDFLEPVGGRTALIASDEPEHLRRRRHVQPAFHGKHLARWISVAEEEFTAWFDDVRDRERSTDLYRDAKPVLVAIVSRILFGDGGLAANRSWLRDVHALMDYPGKPMLEQLWKVDLPGTEWSRFVAARRRVDAALYDDIRARRRATDRGAAVDEGVTAIGLLMKGETSAGTPLSDTEVRDQSLSLLSAGFDTTAAALAWTASYALRSRSLDPRLVEAVRGHDPVTIQREEFVDAFVKESLRLRPPAAALLRRTSRDVRVAGYDLPPGTRLAWSAWLTHRDDRWWSRPHTFDPERFLTSSVEPFSFLPFGHGIRHCIGAATSTALVKVAIALLVDRYRPALLGPTDPRPVGMTLQPDGGVNLALT